jgi:formylmethanofuran dehydrogenase subunit E
MSNFIKLPTGSIIRKTSIQAVRVVDAYEPWLHSMEPKLKPRVIIDYAVGGSAMSTILESESNEERDIVAAHIKDQLIDKPQLMPTAVCSCCGEAPSKDGTVYTTRNGHLFCKKCEALRKHHSS